ncbi:MAG: S41 family peptidase [Myxococcota bacterium]
MLAVLASVALAGDQPLYERALGLVDEHYLRPEEIDRVAMFSEAGRQLESRIEWLIVEDAPGRLVLRDGSGAWREEVELVREVDLPVALAELEDAVARANLPLDPELDVRVEILRGVVRGLDRHSVILHADGLERFDERLSGTLSGIGATIGLDEARRLWVKDLHLGGPAIRAGLQVNDRITRIDGVRTTGMSTDDATDRIRGLAGTSVTVGVERGEAALDVVIRREEIALRNVTVARGPEDVGLLTIDHFSEQTRTWMADGLAELADMGVLANGLLVDVRGNTGGSLIQSAQAADTFLQSGLIVATVGRDQKPVPSLVARMEAHPENPPYAMPLAVLMDRATASGSEILAGALARLDRALLVGTNSFGKGTVQKVYQLDPAIKLKLTVAEYLLEGDHRVVDVGLQPDLELEEVVFGDGTIWWPSPTRARRHLPPGTPIVRYAATAGDDPPARIAAAIVAAAEGGSRADLLDAANRLKDRLAAEEDARLVAAFRERDVDWTAAPAPPGEPVAVDLALAFSQPPEAGRVVELQATLTNRGPALWRAAIRLESVNPLWDDVVVPIGAVPAGGVASGVTRVLPGALSPARTDRVTVTLEADGVDPTPLDSRTLPVLGGVPVAIAVQLRAHPEEGGLRVALDLQNRGDRPLAGAIARFRFPDVEGIELGETGSKPVPLPAGRSAKATLHLVVKPSWTERTLPLALEIADEELGTVAVYELALPRDGTPLHLDPPAVSVDPPPQVLAPGATTLRLRAADDRGLDHVVVYGGTESMNRLRAEPTPEYQRDKLAYRAMSGRRGELEVPVEIVPGTNHFQVVAEDRMGLRTVRDVYVLGEDGPIVTGE